MPRYIDADVLKGLMERENFGTPDERWRSEAEFYGMVDLVPTADVAPVEHGEWIDVETLCYGVKQKVCSKCKDDEYWKKYFCHGNENYCPNCGAKMDGGK